jgi:secretion/DNA translocation related CpaE-like protein
MVLAGSEAPEKLWEAAISIGAQRVLRLPSDEQALVAAFADVDESADRTHLPGRTVAVIGGRGGCGASVFSAALAMAAGDALLIDVDPWGGGLDLLLGGERRPGLRWPDLAVQGGRVNPTALREALPRINGVSVLSAARAGGDVAAGSLRAVADAGRRGGATVICDLPRRLTAAVEQALDAADLVVMIGQCDVRSCASIAAMAPTLLAANPNVGLVLRGPAPGGLRAAEVARMADLPLLAAIRADPSLAEMLEHGRLRLRRRSALARAARRVLAVLDRQPWVEAA